MIDFDKLPAPTPDSLTIGSPIYFAHYRADGNHTDKYNRPCISVGRVVDESKFEWVVYIPRYVYTYLSGNKTIFGGEVFFVKKSDGYQHGKVAGRSWWVRRAVDVYSIPDELIEAQERKEYVAEWYNRTLMV